MAKQGISTMFTVITNGIFDIMVNSRGVAVFVRINWCFDKEESRVKDVVFLLRLRYDI